MRRESIWETRPCSYKGVPLMVENIRHFVQKKLGLAPRLWHEGSNIQSMEREDVMIELHAMLLAPDLAEKRTALKEALNESSDGMLDLPNLGIMRKVYVQNYSFLESEERLGMIRVLIRFVELSNSTLNTSAQSKLGLDALLEDDLKKMLVNANPSLENPNTPKHQAQNGEASTALQTENNKETNEQNNACIDWLLVLCALNHERWNIAQRLHAIQTHEPSSIKKQTACFDLLLQSLDSLIQSLDEGAQSNQIHPVRLEFLNFLAALEVGFMKTQIVEVRIMVAYVILKALMLSTNLTFPLIADIHPLLKKLGLMLDVLFASGMHIQVVSRMQNTHTKLGRHVQILMQKNPIKPPMPRLVLAHRLHEDIQSLVSASPKAHPLFSQGFNTQTKEGA